MNKLITKLSNISFKISEKSRFDLGSENVKGIIHELNFINFINSLYDSQD